ncbi:metal ABC transporter permease [Oleiphilus messinensis]|nr:metal ABC transporter permease [Oleiphilus messinensis]
MITTMLWLWLPCTASLLLCIALVPLGRQVLTRGVVFADIAIAQWAALGVIVQSQWSAHWLSLIQPLPVLGLLSALICAFGIKIIVRAVPAYREAMIGILYVFAASLSTLVVSQDPHGAQLLATAMNGDLLWTSKQHLIPLVLSAVLVLLWCGIGVPQLRAKLFLPLFALVVTLAVDLAGIYVVFATLIVAPLLLCHLRGSRTALAIVVSFTGHVAGLCGSAIFDWPAGAVVVVAIVLISVSVTLLLQNQRNRSQFLSGTV